MDEERFPSDRPLRIVRRAVVVAACGLGLGLLWIASRKPDLVEAYANGVWPLLSRPLAAISGLFPFGVGELLLWLVVLALLARTAWTLTLVWRGRRSLRNAIACGLLGAAEGACVIGLLFVVLWGMNYSRPDAIERLHWPSLSTTESPADELARISEALVVHANLEREAAAPPTPNEIDRAIDTGYERVAESLSLSDRFAASRGPAKFAVGSGLMSAFAISGIYFPFTAEANVNSQVPESERPFVVAHEKAHQRGIAAEDEANFFGFLACASSPDAWVRYSGYLFAQRQLLRELEHFQPERVRDLVARRSSAVQRDVDDSNAFWAKHRGFFARVGRTVNDAYLELNGVVGGIDSYDRSARLLTLFARVNHGTCIVGN